MLNLLSLTTILLIGKLAGFLLNALMLVGVVGSILLVATLINKHLTKKEQQNKDKDK